MELSDVVRHEDAGPCADSGGEDWDVLRVCKLASPFPVVRCRAVELEWNRTEELLEERLGFGELGGQIPSYIGNGGFRDNHAKASIRTHYNALVTVAPVIKYPYNSHVYVEPYLLT